MPLLTVTNLRTSSISIQDPTGSAFIVITVPGSSTVTDRVLTNEQFSALEPQLRSLEAAAHVSYSLKDNAASLADGSSVAGPSTFVKDEDFTQAAGGTLPSTLAKDLHNSATGDYLSDAACGVYALATEATSSAESAQLTYGNQLVLNPAKGLVFEARTRLNIPGATPSADERWVIGLCSDHTNAEDALDATVSNVWFRGEGANLNIYVEGDDGTTDTDDVDSGIDYVDNVFMYLKIDMTDLTKIKFYVNSKLVPTTVSAPLLSASTPLQPIFCYQRDAGAEINILEIDWYRVTQAR